MPLGLYSHTSMPPACGGIQIAHCAAVQGGLILRVFWARPVICCNMFNITIYNNILQHITIYYNMPQYLYSITSMPLECGGIQIVAAVQLGKVAATG